MKKAFLYIIFVFGIAAVCVSCQGDTISENDSEALGSLSGLTGLLSSITVDNTFTGTTIDSTDCFNIVLPVAVIVNGQQLTVNTPSDYETVAGIFNQSSTDEDTLQLTFPLTVVFADYTQQMVTSKSEYDSLVAACNTQQENVAQCIAINYPVSVFGYNSNFQVENTYTLNSNQDIYQFLQNLGSNEYYSIDYPVTVNYAGNTQVIVNNNDEFMQVIQTAIQNCVLEDAVAECTNPGILTDDLVLYMPFSNNVADLMGSIVVGPTDTAFVTDRSGSGHCAIAFNGNQQLQITSSADNALIDGNEISISLWFKMQNTNIGNYEVLFGKGAGDSTGFELALYDLNKPVFVAGNNNIWDDSADFLAEDTQNWHHLVLTLNSNYEAQLYRDGELQQSQPFVNASVGGTAADYFVGSGFTGYLDDLRVYKKVLTAQEVQTLYELEGDCSICLG
ncbi:LamG domain-containing protein [Flavobacterium rhizosphaerae]|uniref:LamG domain-containing protein n=1 Tax=Flavobacterium rhizosphaerae TaxID=3163298 RepID=A0ABW8YXS5_9FLAO